MIASARLPPQLTDHDTMPLGAVTTSSRSINVSNSRWIITLANQVLAPELLAAERAFDGRHHSFSCLIASRNRSRSTVNSRSTALRDLGETKIQK